MANNDKCPECGAEMKNINEDTWQCSGCNERFTDTELRDAETFDLIADLRRQLAAANEQITELELWKLNARGRVKELIEAKDALNAKIKWLDEEVKAEYLHTDEIENENDRMRAAIQSFLQWENEKPIADRTDKELLEQTELLAEAAKEK